MSETDERGIVPPPIPVGAPLPVPPVPTRAAEPPPEPKTKVRHAMRAAFDHPPSRASDQAFYWIVTLAIKATKELGFPVVMVFILSGGAFYFGREFLATQKTALATQQALLVQNYDTGRNAQIDATAAIREMAAAQTESNEITRTLMTEMGLRPPPRKKK